MVPVRIRVLVLQDCQNGSRGPRRLPKWHNHFSLKVLDKSIVNITIGVLERDIMKQYRELKKLLENEGFVLVKDGNHCLYEKGGKTICVTKNVRDAKTLFRKALGQWRQQTI